MGRKKRKADRRLKKLKLNLELPLDSKRKAPSVVEEVFDGETGELRGEIVEVDVGNGEQPARVYRSAPPLLRLKARGAISESEYEAGARFAKDYGMAKMNPRFVSIDYTRAMVDASIVNRDFVSAGFGDLAKRCVEAMQHVGSLGASLLLHVVGNDVSFSDWVMKYARPNNWGRSIDQTSAMWVLRATLSSLVGFYREKDRENSGWLRTIRD